MTKADGGWLFINREMEYAQAVALEWNYYIKRPAQLAVPSPVETIIALNQISLQQSALF